jgi:hydroxylaminobenzene mutase
MFLVAGLVIAHLGLGADAFSRRILISGPWLAWPIALTEMANAWWGSGTMFPIAAQQAGASGAAPWQEGTLNRDWLARPKLVPPMTWIAP